MTMMTKEQIEALEGGVRVKPGAAETLAKEMQMIVAADRWKGRSLDAAPPEKWHRLRPETRQFWIDTASRILSALSTPPDDVSGGVESRHAQRKPEGATGRAVHSPKALRSGPQDRPP